jgi:hypothetical protein
MEPTGEWRIDILQRQAKGLDISGNMAFVALAARWSDGPC